MSRFRRLARISFANKLTRVWLATAVLALSIFNTPLAAFAQGQGEKRVTKPEIQLGIDRSDLIAKDADSVFPISPVAEDNIQGNSSVSPFSALRPDIHGETSVENFQGIHNNLLYTHDSADGFRNWLEGYGPQSNFHYKDAGVSTWLFHDYSNFGRNYDLWPSGGIDYGIDAVRVAWHSSYGVTSNNIFSTSMGWNWDNTGWSAQSNLMALGGNYYSFGDERLRYLFWDTGQSIRIDGGNDPYSTWGPFAKGIRFIFGYTTDSIDSPYYGSSFGYYWNAGETLTNAFLDASWSIYQYQSPITMAFGSTFDEAASRRDSERYFYPEAVNNYWAAWRWYYARTLSKASLATSFTLASQAGPIEVGSRGNSNEEVAEIAKVFGIVLQGENSIKSGPSGLKNVQTNAATLTVEKDGSYDLRLNVREAENNADPVLSDDLLIARARELTNQLSFVDGQNLRVGMVRDLNENAGAAGSIGEARVAEKTIIFDQTINGLSFIDPKAGHLEITFGASSGQVRRIRNTLKPIQAEPTGNATAQTQVMSQQEARQQAIAKFNKTASNTNAKTTSMEIVEGSEDVGYQMIDGKAVLVYRALLKSSADSNSRPSLAVIPLQK